MRADEIVIDTAKPGKVTEVVAVMSINCRKKSIHRALILKTRSLSTTRWKVVSFWRRTTANQETFLRK
jgi:hypothetical protein